MANIFYWKLWPTLRGRQVAFWVGDLPASHTDVVQQPIPLLNPRAMCWSEFGAQSKQKHKTQAVSKKSGLCGKEGMIRM